MNKKAHLEWLLSMNNNQSFAVQKQGKVNSPRILYPSGYYEVSHRVLHYSEEYKTSKPEVIVESCKMTKADVLLIANNRQVMPFEVVFDIDEEDSLAKATHILGWLSGLGLVSSVWESGGKGHHVHCYIGQLADMDPTVRRVVRGVFFNQCGVKVDEQLKSDNVTIALEYSSHRRTMRDKQIVAGQIRMNQFVPAEIITATMIQSQEEQRLAHIAGTELYPKNCIEYFQTAIIPEGNRERVLFSVLSNLKKSMSDSQLVAFGKEFSYRHNQFMSHYDIVQKVESVKRNDRITGCRFNVDLLKAVGKEELCRGCIWYAGKCVEKVVQVRG